MRTGKNVVIKLFAALLAAAMLMVTVLIGMFDVQAKESDSNDVFAFAQTKPGKWYADFETFEEERDYAAEFSKELMEEGAVLMKNADDTLPLKGKENITLFGSRSYNPVKGGTGSGGSYKDDPRMVDLPQGLRNAGFSLNAAVEKLYGEGAETEQDPAMLERVTGSYVFYGDAAIVTFGRTSGEGHDLQKFNVPGHSDKTETELELDDNEEALLEHIKEHFDTIIVLVNTATVLEISELVNDPQISAIVWIGMSGHFGLDAVGRILNGEVNPSGALADLWMEDLKHDPTWANHGTNEQNNVYDPVTGKVLSGNYNNQAYSKGENGPEANDRTAVIEYEEGIYLGYKYYETVYAEILDGSIAYDVANDELYTVTEARPAAADKQANADAYWADEVVYPFGYGLSYTTFEEKLLTSDDEIEAAINGATGLDDTFNVKVRVTNSGDVAGKQIVQFYESAPYTDGGVEKSAVTLVSFAKSDTLLPGESQDVELTVRIGDLASFDYNNASGKFGAGNGGYILEQGTYAFSVRENSHDVVASVDTVINEKVWNKDGDPQNVFSKGDDFDSMLNDKEGGEMTVLSRADMVGTFPKAATAEDKTYSDKLMTLLVDSSVEAGTADTGSNNRNESRYTSYYNSSDDKTTDLWYQTAVEEFAKYANDKDYAWTQAKVEADGKITGRGDPVLVTSYGTVDMCGWEGQQPHESWVSYTEIQLYQMVGIDYDSDEVLDGDEVALAKEGGKFHGLTGRQAWAVFMNQLTWEEIVNFISNGSYKTQELLAVGKEESMDADGPAVMNPDGTYWPCEVVIASTWNTELAHQQGVLVGNESLFQDVPGWYGSGMNLHRSPFSGRNFEYYSSDGVHGGFIAAAVISGVQSKGMNCYIKHFAVNDQEQNRSGVGTFLTEQSMREIYVKPFEYAVKFGHATGTMTAMNRIGGIRCFGNYRLNTTLLRDEWGFKGAVVTDASSGQVKGNMMIRSGNDLPLSSYSGQDSISGTWDPTLRNGLGGVRDGNAAADGTVPQSDVQYYYARTAAMRLLWVACNTNCNENSFDQREISTAITESAFKDAPFSTDAAVIDPAELGVISVAYRCEGLPEGLSIDSQTGIISGVPTTVDTEGTQTTIEYVIDKWIIVRRYITITVADSWAVEDSSAEGEIAKITYSDDAKNSIIGVHFSFEGPDMFGMMMVTYDAVYTDVKLQAVGLPEGISMSEDGTVTGTLPAGQGLDIVVNVIGVYDAEAACATSYNDAEKVIATMTFHVGGESTGSHGGIASAEINENDELVLTYEDGYVQNLGVVVGQDGQNGAPGEAGGCGSSLAAGSAALAVVALIGGVAFILGKKRVR